MNFVELGIYTLATALLIITPCAVTVLVVSAGLRGGLKSAFMTIVGTNLASLVLIAISIAILKGFLKIDERIFLAIKLFGCLYIAYLGYDMLKSYLHKQNNDLAELKPVNGGFKKGFIVGIANPQDIIFFSAFFPQFINIHTNINVSFSILIAIWILLDFSILLMFYKLSSLLKSNSTLYSKILAGCGLLLIIISAYGIFTSFI